MSNTKNLAVPQWVLAIILTTVISITTSWIVSANTKAATNAATVAAVIARLDAMQVQQDHISTQVDIILKVMLTHPRN